jgi:hypothetical protein
VRYRILVAIMCLAAAPSFVRAQIALSAGCTQDKNRVTCNAAAFAVALRNAANIAVDSQPLSRIADEQLASLVSSLGKASTPGQKTSTSGQADLTFVLVRIDDDGINYGPNDRELASLRVYSPGREGARGPLVWDEPFWGQPDIPWPAVVHKLILQFKNDIKGLPR